MPFLERIIYIEYFQYSFQKTGIKCYSRFNGEIELPKISRLQVEFGKSCKTTSKHSAKWTFKGIDVVITLTVKCDVQLPRN